MLDLGFLPDVEKLLAMTPETRQTMLFSATMPAAIVSLARTHMRHPMNIRAESADENADGAGDRAVHLPGARPGQARDDRPAPAGRGRRQDDRLHPHQARRRSGWPTTWSSAASRPARCTVTWRRWRARRRWPGSARTRSRCSSRPTSPPAASTSPASRHVINYTLPRGREDLHPPDRPHRPRRRHGHRGHVRRLGRRAPVEDDQQGARAAVRGAAETYSTSEHLFHDQGIPPGTKGRIVDPAPVERKPRADRDRATAVARRRPRRWRRAPNRWLPRAAPATRTRGGGPAAAPTAAASAAPQAAAAQPQAQPTHPRRRERPARRRRSR